MLNHTLPCAYTSIPWPRKDVWWMVGMTAFEISPFLPEFCSPQRLSTSTRLSPVKVMACKRNGKNDGRDGLAISLLHCTHTTNRRKKNCFLFYFFTSRKTTHKCKSVAVKTHGGWKNMLCAFLTLELNGVCDYLQTTAVSPPSQLNWKVRKSQSMGVVDEKNLTSPYRESNPGRLTCSHLVSSYIMFFSYRKTLGFLKVWSSVVEYVSK